MRGGVDFQRIVQCEKELLTSFEWDFHFLLPLHFVGIYLANGVLLSSEMAKLQSEFTDPNRKDFECANLVKRLANEADRLCEFNCVFAKQNLGQTRGESPSAVAAAVVY